MLAFWYLFTTPNPRVHVGARQFGLTTYTNTGMTRPVQFHALVRVMTRFLMKTIRILRHEQFQSVVARQSRQGDMPIRRRGVPHQVIPVLGHFPVAFSYFLRSEPSTNFKVLRVEPIPNPAFGPEIGNAALGADAGAGQAHRCARFQNPCRCFLDEFFPGITQSFFPRPEQVMAITTTRCEMKPPIDVWYARMEHVQTRSDDSWR